MKSFRAIGWPLAAVAHGICAREGRGGRARFRRSRRFAALVAWLMCSPLLVPCVFSQVPQIVNYQGRVVVSGINFDGTGSFKFALVNATGTTTYWSNDGTSSAGSQPAGAVALNVSKGLYSVLLGDTGVANMTTIPPSVFNNSDVRRFPCQKIRAGRANFSHTAVWTGSEMIDLGRSPTEPVWATAAATIHWPTSGWNLVSASWRAAGPRHIHTRGLERN